jgi:hypothetical protein
MTSPIKNEDKTIDNLEALKLLTNFAKLTFNDHIYSVYSGKSEANQKAKAALLIKDNDSMPIITNKVLLFFLALQKLETSVQEHYRVSTNFKEKDPEMIRGTIKLNPALKYNAKGNSVGTRQIEIPHLDESRIHELRGFQFKHGKTIVLYTFTSGKQIKLNAYDEAEGKKALATLIKLVDPKWLAGSVEDHAYIGKKGKDVPNGDLFGIVSKATAIHVSDLHGKLYTVFI